MRVWPEGGNRAQVKSKDKFLPAFHNRVGFRSDLGEYGWSTRLSLREVMSAILSVASETVIIHGWLVCKTKDF